jgi:hypothetical protein
MQGYILNGNNRSGLIGDIEDKGVLVGGRFFNIACPNID